MTGITEFLKAFVFALFYGAVMFWCAMQGFENQERNLTADRVLSAASITMEDK